MSSRVLQSLTLGLLCLAGTTHAADVTLSDPGSNFDLIYDNAALGLFGAPTLSNNVLFFTPNNFKAESLNGGQLVTQNSTISGIRLVSKPGYSFVALALGESGDYKLSGAGSFVTVGGQLRAFDINNSIPTQTTSAITVSGSTPLTLIDGTSHNWVASAFIDVNTPSFSASPPIPPFFPGIPPVQGWLDKSTKVGVTIENLMSAYTSPGVSPSQAFIEKKFAGGIALTVTSAIPEPGTWALMAAGLLATAFAARRRTR